MFPPLLSTWFGLLLLFLVTFALANVAHVTASALVARAARVRVLEVSLFIGPRLWSRTYGGVAYSLRGLPFGGFVTLQGLEPEGGAEPGSFRALHPLARAAVALAGPLGTLLLSMAMLGVESGGQAFLAGFPQILHTFVSPLGYGIQMGFRAFQLIEQGNPFYLAGILAAKLAAFNCLPVPSLGGGQALMTLLQWRGRWPAEVERRLLLVGLLISLLLSASLGVALINTFVNVSLVTP